MADVKKDVWEHWSQCLKCAICFCCLQDPHTLECGHTFCKKCLKKLAGFEREDNPGVPRRRLLLVCPTCRNMFPAKPTLKEKTSTNICMKHLVEMWGKECDRIKKSAMVRFRSTSTQTTQTVITQTTNNLVSRSNMLSLDLDPKPNINIDIKDTLSLCDLMKPSPALYKFDQGENTEMHLSSIKDSVPFNITKLPSPIRTESTEIITSAITISPFPKSPAPSENIPLISEPLPYLTTDSNDSLPCVTTTKADSDVSDEEFIDRVCPDQQYLKLLLKCVLEFYEDQEDSGHWKYIKTDTEDEMRRSSALQTTQRTPHNPTSVEPASIVNSENSSSSETDTSRSSSNNSVALNQSHSDASLSEVFGRISISGLTLRREFTIGRVMLILLWCIYSVIIVAIADSLMPYITVATFFTFLLFLG